MSSAFDCRKSQFDLLDQSKHLEEVLTPLNIDLCERGLCGDSYYRPVQQVYTNHNNSPTIHTLVHKAPEQTFLSGLLPLRKDILITSNSDVLNKCDLWVYNDFNRWV